jgi:hypothetical protein
MAAPRLNTEREALILNAISQLDLAGFAAEAAVVSRLWYELEQLREGNRRRHTRHQERKRHATIKAQLDEWNATVEDN